MSTAERDSCADDDGHPRPADPDEGSGATTATDEPPPTSVPADGLWDDEQTSAAAAAASMTTTPASPRLTRQQRKARAAATPWSPPLPSDGLPLPLGRRSNIALDVPKPRKRRTQPSHRRPVGGATVVPTISVEVRTGSEMIRPARPAVLPADADMRTPEQKSYDRTVMWTIMGGSIAFAVAMCIDAFFNK